MGIGSQAQKYFICAHVDCQSATASFGLHYPRSWSPVEGNTQCPVQHVTFFSVQPAIIVKDHLRKSVTKRLPLGKRKIFVAHICQSRQEMRPLPCPWRLRPRPHSICQEKQACLIVGVPVHAARRKFPRSWTIRVRGSWSHALVQAVAA